MQTINSTRCLFSAVALLLAGSNSALGQPAVTGPGTKPYILLPETIVLVASAAPTNANRTLSRKLDRGDKVRAQAGASGKTADVKSKYANKQVVLRGNARPGEGALDKERAIKLAQSAGILGVLGRLQGPPFASIFGRRSAITSEAEDALGGLIREPVGSIWAPDFLVSLASGPDSYRVHGATPRGQRATGSTPDERRSLDTQVIPRIIRRHMYEVKFCYEQELAKKADLTGGISVQFSIAGTGQVKSPVMRDSTMGNARVEECVLSAVRRWEFPRPANGATVVVTHPLSFVAKGG